jgi:glycosyltransferase involved in cell wall biosynthesis
MVYLNVQTCSLKESFTRRQVYYPFCGRFAPEKQQEIILQAIQLSNKDKIQLILVGKNDEGKLEENGEICQINYFGITAGRTVKYYNTADLFVHAATIVMHDIMEAMGCITRPYCR